MSYKLKFLPTALKEWKKLGPTVRDQFKKKLEERLDKPVVESDKLRGAENCYKIKLRSSGYRLVYEVEKKNVVIYLIAVGKRNNNWVYKTAKNRRRK
tara:strand:- start:363 stop:653 length:291 start_codon:yes stop_codon:yes gene_type:complete